MMYLKKELYELIRTDESIFDFIQERALDGLWYWDLEKPENQWMNARFWIVLGYNPGEMPHKSVAWQDIINQDDFKSATKNLTKHCENFNHPYDQIVRYTHKSGSTVWIRCRGFAIRDKDGKAIRMLGAHQDVSDSKQSEQRFERLFRDIETVSVQGYSLDGTVLYWNNASTQLYGYTEQEAIGRNLLDLIIPSELHDTVSDEIRTMAKTRRPIPASELTLRRKDGSPVTVFSSHSFAEVPGQEPEFFCIDIELSERKKVEQQLIVAKEKAEESEKKFLQIAENIGEVYWIRSFDNKKMLYISPAYEKVWGRTCQSLYDNPQSFIDSIYDEDKPAVIAELDQYKKGKAFNLEYRIVSGSGKIKWVRVKTARVKNAKGEVIRHVGTAVDITSIKNFQQTLELLVGIAKTFINIPLENISKEINNALETMGGFVNADRVYIFDYDWDKQICNNTYEWCRDGISPEIENLQQVPLEVMPWWVDAHKQGKKLSIADVCSLNEFDGVRKILEPQGVKSLLTLPLMQSGECVGFMGFDSVRDHHQYTHREEVILVVFSEIIVNIQNRKAQENSLVLEKEKAEQSDKLKTAFINNISHEIRTPLNGIVGFGQMLFEGDLPAGERADIFHNLMKSSNRLMDTITDYMDMSMIFSGTIKVSNKEIKLKPLFEKTAGKAKKLILEKNIDFKIEIPTHFADLKVTSDPFLLEKILYKLLDNAIKFTKNGSIKCGYEKKPEYVNLFVQDTGSGIASDKLKLIFEMFRQADTSMTRGYEGSGLGLTIAKELVSLLGGEIMVTSEQGKGSEFTFTIPLNPSGEFISGDET